MKLILTTFLLLNPLAHAENVISFSKAKKELTKIYQSLPDAKTYYCDCDIKWKGKKGSPVAES